MLALQQVFSICNTHSEALRDALHDLQTRNLQTMEILHPCKEDRRLLDQFAYRYIRLQLTIQSAVQVLQIFEQIAQKMLVHFPDLNP